jgi:membrane protease YdiL (CAAX protease family)
VILFVGLAVILVGAGVYRTRAQVIERLALRKLTPRAVAVALGAVIVVILISGMASVVTDWLQPSLYDDLQQVTKDMTADVQNPIGAIALGLSAGIGEELLMRGAIQPRFGIFLTSLLFAILHTQYGLTFVLVGLFLIGMLLGKLRNRYGTAAPIITHAVFNAIVVLAQSAN